MVVMVLVVPSVHCLTLEVLVKERQPESSEKLQAIFTLVAEVVVVAHLRLSQAELVAKAEEVKVDMIHPRVMHLLLVLQIVVAAAVVTTMMDAEVEVVTPEQKNPLC